MPKCKKVEGEQKKIAGDDLEKSQHKQALNIKALSMKGNVIMEHEFARSTFKEM